MGGCQGVLANCCVLSPVNSPGKMSGVRFGQMCDILDKKPVSSIAHFPPQNMLWSLWGNIFVEGRAGTFLDQSQNLFYRIPPKKHACVLITKH